MCYDVMFIINCCNITAMLLLHVVVINNNGTMYIRDEATCNIRRPT